MKTSFMKHAFPNLNFYLFIKDIQS